MNIEERNLVDEVSRYRKLHRKLTGRRVRCVEMNDPDPVPVGTEGTVNHVDDVGTIHVTWDNGRLLGLVPGEDKYELI
jgi:hypothetical protein